MESDKKVTRKYRDSVFTALFSDEQSVLELYNALEGKNYPIDTKIEINTLDDVLYLDRINDVSFLIKDKLVVLVEQQSSINMNMALRFLLYLNKLYERMIVSNELNIYRKNLIKIPRPEFICLYNGKDDFPDEKILKLSDSFENTDDNNRIDLELVVRVININKGRNEETVKESKTLSDYVFFTDRIRANIEQKFSLNDAVDESVRYCLENGILDKFLKKYRSEVISMLATEFDMEKALEAMRLDCIEQGIEQKERDVVIKLLDENFTDDKIIVIAGISSDRLNELKKLYYV